MIQFHPWTRYDARHLFPDSRGGSRVKSWEIVNESGTRRTEDANRTMSESEDGTRGFKVTDRRKFNSDGDLRSTSETQEEQTRTEPVSDVPQPGANPAESGAREAERPRRTEVPPEVGFVDLVHMLVSNALMQLGDLPDPVSGENVENLQGVQVMIGFLEMLQEKTKGNLSEEEIKILDSVLYDLRMRFMAKANLIKS